MNAWRLFITAIVLSFLARNASTVQTAPPAISIIGQQAGATPFISILTLSTSDASALKSIQFTVAPTPGSATRPISATYVASYLAGRGYTNSQTGQITVPVFGLYANYSNNVALTYAFNDGSSQQDSVVITTSSYNDPCGFNNPIVLQARTQGTDLSYDYILIKSRCRGNSPTIIDADGAIRWVGPQNVAGNSFTFFDNAVYDAGVGLGRTELDGTYTVLVPDYKTYGISYFNHNTDYGKYGMILDATTATYVESVDLEVDRAGNVLKVWNLADIISVAMTAGGDDPSQFVYPSPTDWFHDNSAAYRASDNSMIVSSRENFLICLDYDTGAIKWILGDPTKKWYQFPSLRRYALTVAPGGVPPIGQHAPSITQDDNLLVFDNGTASNTQTPAGASRNYSAPRKYQLDLQAKLATEVWNYTRNQSVQAAYCSSVYEDAASNYLVDYAYRHLSGTTVAEILGLNAAGQTVFDYAYPAPSNCRTAFNAIPLHLEQLVFSAALPSPSSSPTPTPTATPTVQVTVQTNPAALAFSVDGTTYTSTQTFSWKSGSAHNIATSSPQNGGTGVQYVWKSWSGGGPISHTVTPTTNKTYTATFTTQYYLAMNRGTGGTVSPASGWKNSGTAVSISATPTNNTSVSYSFAGWTGTGTGSYSGTNNPASITMNGPITENASFTQNPIQVTVQTDPTGRMLAVDGTSYTSTHMFSWQPGSSHTIATTSPQNGATGVRYVWTNWSGGGAISHTVAPTTNKTYTANFNTQYFLTMSHNTGGSVTPASAWKASGATISITAKPSSVYHFTNWAGIGTGSYSGTNNPASITMGGPITETATFTHN